MEPDPKIQDPVLKRVTENVANPDLVLSERGRSIGDVKQTMKCFVLLFKRLSQDFSIEWSARFRQVNEVCDSFAS